MRRLVVPIALAALSAGLIATNERSEPPQPLPVVASPAMERPELPPKVRQLATGPVPKKISRATRSRTSGAITLPEIMLRVRSCESGPNGYATHGWAFDYNYSETNDHSSASGAWQFLDSTWHYVTHLPGRAKDYSRATQDWGAMKLYHSEGLVPWRDSRPCWGR